MNMIAYCGNPCTMRCSPTLLPDNWLNGSLSNIKFIALQRVTLHETCFSTCQTKKNGLYTLGVKSLFLKVRSMILRR